MDKKLKVEKRIEINADSKKVWTTLTDPEKIKEYFFGTEVISEWKKGQPIIFQGDFQGQKYRDKGTILEIEPGKLLHYDYWSGFSGMEDKPENYSLVTYRLESDQSHTTVTLTQQGFANKEAHQHSESAWTQVLQKMKEVAERS